MATKDQTIKTGKCYLVGAGPGDLGLVTLRAKECIQHADVVIYDYLCNPEILKWSPETAEVIFAGKKAGAHLFKQEEINALLVEKARAGKQVVRLKGGDPFLFGRGGEEALALVAAGIPFEIVPGVSSAIAGPAFAGIPVTHRGISSSLEIFTGHEDPEKGESSIDFSALVRGGTQVALMGMERLKAITREMQEQGMRGDLPVALIRWATTGRQRTLVGTLANIGQRAKAAALQAPVIAVFGDVVRLREKLNWFEAGPLFGKRIVVTRSQPQSGAFSEKLRSLGADVLELSAIRIEPPSDLRAFAELVQDAHSYDWIVFTSPNGVTAFFDMFYKLYGDAREIGAARIAAIGPGTAKRVQDFRFQVDLQPTESVAEALLHEFQRQGSVENQRILLAQAERARDVLSRELSKLGAIVDEAIAYRTVAETRDITGARRRLREDGADLIAFTSSSTVENFLATGLAWPEGMRVASIGPITSKTARDRGLKVDIEARDHDIPGLVDAIRGFYERQGS